jgi:hypothetical protein
MQALCRECGEEYQKTGRITRPALGAGARDDSRGKTVRAPLSPPPPAAAPPPSEQRASTASATPAAPPEPAAATHAPAEPMSTRGDLSARDRNPHSRSEIKASAVVEAPRKLGGTRIVPPAAPVVALAPLAPPEPQLPAGV